MPAAIVGIVLFAVVGFTVAGGWDAINAQVGGGGQSSSSLAGSTASAGVSTAVEIHITMTGFEPASVSVRPGQKITWFNEQDIPHILTSQTLRDGSGSFLNTSAIFPNGKISFTVGAQEQPKQHVITSTTDGTLKGTVIVSLTAAAPGSSSSSKKAPLGSLDGVNLPTGQGGAQTGATASSRSSSNAASVAVTGTVPPPVAPIPTQNPLSGGTVQTFDTFAPPSTIIPSQTPQNFAPVTPAPAEQPHTGPGLWVVALMSVTILWRVTRKYFVRIA